MSAGLLIAGALILACVGRPLRAAPPETSAPTHWSLRPVVRPALPTVRDATWGRDPLDRFIQAKRDGAGIAPNPDADRRTLLRRIAFDLTGLPPTDDEIEAFVENRGAEDAALARAVDRYLDSPRFGERWARHWLDVARYADSVGRAWNAPFTYAFRYRDYVIDSFNRSTPYDRFVIEQLAGDLLPAASVAERRRNLTATAFLALGAIDIQSLSYEQFVLDRVDDQIDVTTRAFLGLTVSCARCHDHKYDPIAMRDYYALAGVFYSSRTYSGLAHKQELGSGMYVDPERLLALPVSLKDRPTDKLTLTGIHSMTDVQDEFRRGVKNARYDTHADLAPGLVEGEPRDCEVRLRGEPYDKGEAPPRGDLHIPGFPRLAPIAADASGRLELARALASPKHPLTARVFVNRVWQHLFGRGIVRTVDDFGSTGELPSHPELLDHLASRFAEDWSVKNLIRAIVLSRTYRQSSAGHAANEKLDGGNLLYWRADQRRLELEPLRDSLLMASGRLTFDRPEGVQVAGTGGKGRMGTVRSLLTIDSPYRTVYLPVLRSLLPEMYGTFDFPDPSQIEGQRHVTTVATQALFLMNSSFTIDCADAAAERLLARKGTEVERLHIAWVQLLSREPDAEEKRAAGEFLGSLKPPVSTRNPERYRWSALLQALMQTAEFRTVR